jgi:hypothetical protein
MSTVGDEQHAGALDRSSESTDRAGDDYPGCDTTMVDNRHRDALRRIGQADAQLQREGREPDTFHLQHEGGMRRSIDHARWDDSWASPSEHTIDDLADLGFLRVAPSHNKARSFTLTMIGRDEAAKLIQELEGSPSPDDGNVERASTGVIEPPERSPSIGGERARDPDKVAVMHGRDVASRKAVFDLLRRLGLQPLEWDELVDRTGSAAPYNGAAVAAAFEVAQAVVVVLTPDDVGFLHPALHGPRERDDDYNPTGQPRLNVVLEAGMALQSHPKQTILLELGYTREISDLAGRNTVRLDGTPERFNGFANRLETAGCPVQRKGSDWLDAEGFTKLDALTRVAQQFTPASPAAVAVDREARIRARHVAVELATMRRTVESLTWRGYLALARNPLPAIEWAAARDAFAEHAPTLYRIVANAYVEADQCNKAAADLELPIALSDSDPRLMRHRDALIVSVDAAVSAVESYLADPSERT